jgi:5,10-methylenetetrahydromethanopterin reductase
MDLAFSLPPTMELDRFGTTIERAESWGFDRAYTPDQGFLRDPFVALSHAASRTRRIALGIAITTPYTRHPVHIARAAGTLADLRPSHFVLGLGAGERANLRDKFNAAQTPFLPLVRETVRVLRELFAGRTVSSETPAFSLRNVTMEFVPRHSIPIYLATTDPEGFRLAGEIADGLILGDMADPAVVKWAIDLMREGARGAGRDPAQITVVSWTTTILGSDAAMLKDKLRRVMAMAVTGMNRALRTRMGFDGIVNERLKAALANNAVTADILDDTALDRLMIVGESESCLARIRSLEAAGASQLSVRMPAAVADTVDFHENLQALAKSVLPQFKRNAKHDS